MGLTISGLFHKLFDRKQMKILMLGLDNAGKTTILYRLKLGEVVMTTPTIGFNVETVEYNNISFTVWDVGGQEKIRQLWRFYFDNVDGLIFVVDCSDVARVNTATEELLSVLKEPALQNVALLVLANKQDLPNAVTCFELAEMLGVKGRKRCLVQPCVATKCQGLYEGLDWLSNQLLHIN